MSELPGVLLLRGQAHRVGSTGLQSRKQDTAPHSLRAWTPGVAGRCWPLRKSRLKSGSAEGDGGREGLLAARHSPPPQTDTCEAKRCPLTLL